MLLRMPSAQPLRARRPVLIPLEDRAADNLRFIRETMERAGSFTALPGWGGVAIGLTALAAAPIAASQPSPARWISVWLVEAAAAVAIALITASRKARAARAALFSGPGRKFALSFAPPLAVGALLTPPALYSAGLVGILPAVWLLLYGTAVVTGGAFSARVVPADGASVSSPWAPRRCFRPPHWNSLWNTAYLMAGFGGLQNYFRLGHRAQARRLMERFGAVELSWRFRRLAGYLWLGHRLQARRLSRGAEAIAKTHLRRFF
jgi:hypothetical protein